MMGIRSSQARPKLTIHVLACFACLGGLALIRRRKKGMRGCPGPSARAGIPLRGRGVGISAGVVVLAVCLAATVLPCAADDYITIAGKTYLRQEFRINTGGEKRPDVSYAPNGDFVVAWDMDKTVFARRFARNGQPLTAPILIGSDYMAWYPSVASRSDGSFIVAYQHELVDGAEDIAARIVAPNGAYLTGTLNVNTYTNMNQMYPQVGVDSADRSLIVWQSQNQLGSADEVVGRRLGADGQALTPEFIVNTTTAGGQAFPTVCVSPSGSATVGWFNGVSGSTSARKQTYDTNGAPVGGEVVVAGKSGMWTGNADVATNNSGNTVIVWEEAPSGTNLGHAYFRRYDQLGQAIGDAREVTDRVYLGATPTVAMWPDGRFVVTWYEYGSPQSDCYARLYSPDGLPLDNVFVVNALTAGRQYSPYVAVNAAGDMAFVWWGNDGGYVTLLTPEPATLALLAVGGLAMLRRRRR